MKPRTFFVYVAALLILGGVYYYYDVVLTGRKNAADQAEKRLAAVTQDQVKGFRLRLGNEETVVAATEAGEWEIRSPLTTPADRWIVEGVIRAMVEAEKEKTLGDVGGDLKQYGLDPAFLELTLMDRENRPLGPALGLGEYNPAGQWVYGRKGESLEVFTVSESLRRELKKTLFDLRDRSLVLIPGEKIDRIEFVTPRPVVLERKGIRTWALTAPVQAEADPDEIQKIIFKMLKAKAARYEPRPAGTPGPDAAAPGGSGSDPLPLAHIRVSAKDRTVDLWIGPEEPASTEASPAGAPASGGGYWVQASDRTERMLIGAEAGAGLLQVASDGLVDRHIAAFNRLGLDEIVARIGAKSMRVKRIKNVWDVLEPSDPISQDAQIETFLSALEDWKYEEKLDASPETIKRYRLDQPDLKVELSGPEEPRTVLIGRMDPVEKERLAIRVGDGPVVLVPRNDLLDYLPREILPDPLPEPASPPTTGTPSP
jgi:hypothetical protein